MYQFIHIEAYAKSASKLAGSARAKSGSVRATGKAWSASEILAEALRVDGNMPHVYLPSAPVPLFGDLPGLRAEIDALPDKRPGMRRDTPILGAVVVSAPWLSSDPRTLAWRRDTLAFLKTTFGPHLRAAVAHVDESHDHIHAYFCAPDLGPVKPLHPGMAARARAVLDGAPAMEQGEAYIAAMRRFQDDYYASVGAKHGLLRIGPGRRRLTRAAYNAEKLIAEARALAEAKKAREWEAVAIDFHAAKRALALEAASNDSLRAQLELLKSSIRNVKSTSDLAARHVKLHL